VTQNVATTQSTAAMVQTMLSGVGAILNNKDIDATRSGVAVTAVINTLNAALKAVNVVFGGPAAGTVSTSGTTPPVPGAPTPVRPKL